MPFQRQNMHANGSGKSNLDRDLTVTPQVPLGGNIWVYRPTNGDDIGTIQGANFFLPFFEGLGVGDLIVIVPSTSAIYFSNVLVSNKLTVTTSILTPTPTS